MTRPASALAVGLARLVGTPALSLTVAFGVAWLTPALAGPPESSADKPETEHATGEATELRRLFEAIVEDAGRRDTDRVSARLGELLLTRDELGALFAEPVAERIWLGYRDKLAPALRREAGAAIVEQVARGKRVVTVEEVGPAWPGRTSRGDEKVLAALKARRPMYTVRLHAPGERLGLRLNGFIFLDGRWRALFKAAEFL